MKHENYEILNLIGYGLSKFNLAFIRSFGFTYKTELFRYFVDLGIAETTGVIKNRQDLFDNFFDNGRKEWWQKGDRYIHRKYLIDSLFGDLNGQEYASVVKLYLNELKPDKQSETVVQPIIASKFRKLQETGLEAELFFMNNYSTTQIFADGKLSDARLFGDGYDFQIEITSSFYLVEVKGVKAKSGNLRLTSNEFGKAQEYKEKFVLAVVSNLIDSPKLTLIHNPLDKLNFEGREQMTSQTYYHTRTLTW